MELLIIGHLLGDFYFQTDKLANYKRRLRKYLVLHGLIYVLAICLMMTLATGKLCKFIIPVLLIGVSHLAVDFVKVEVEKKCKMMDGKEWKFFFLDQIIHISIVIFVACIFNIRADYTWLPEKVKATALYIEPLLINIIAILICGKPAAIIVALVFKAIPRTVEKAEENQAKEEAQEGLKIGSWIGMLEREIMLILGVLGQYGAIGFVLTAKSLARFKQLENQAFAEKYLVGTLLSALIALLGVALCSI